MDKGDRRKITDCCGEKEILLRWTRLLSKQKKHYFVYSAVDVERNELTLIKVYTTRNWLITRSFIKEVLKYCKNKPKFVIDRASWLVEALKSLKLDEHEGFREKEFS